MKAVQIRNHPQTLNAANIAYWADNQQHRPPLASIAAKIQQLNLHLPTNGLLVYSVAHSGNWQQLSERLTFQLIGIGWNPMQATNGYQKFQAECE